jgi:hypothetical protein
MTAGDVRIGTILRTMSWAKDAIAAVAATPPGSPERRRKLDEISVAVARIRQLADAHRGKMAAEIRLAVSVIELGLGRLRPATTSVDPANPGNQAKKKKPHPRLRSNT